MSDVGRFARDYEARVHGVRFKRLVRSWLWKMGIERQLRGSDSRSRAPFLSIEWFAESAGYAGPLPGPGDERDALAGFCGRNVDRRSQGLLL